MEFPNFLALIIGSGAVMLLVWLVYLCSRILRYAGKHTIFTKRIEGYLSIIHAFSELNRRFGLFLLDFHVNKNHEKALRHRDLVEEQYLTFKGTFLQHSFLLPRSMIHRILSSLKFIDETFEAMNVMVHADKKESAGDEKGKELDPGPVIRRMYMEQLVLGRELLGIESLDESILEELGQHTQKYLRTLLDTREN